MQTTLTPYTPTDALDRAPLAVRTKHEYRRELDALRNAGVNPTDHQALQQYAMTLKSSRKAFLMAALRIMTLDTEQQLKAGATPENVNAVTAGLYRLEAMRNAVEVKQPKGVKAHTWLSSAQIVQITSLCPGTLEGRRDWIVLGLLLGAGLRRAELSTLTFDNIKVLPTKAGERTVIEVLHGKGNKSRVIPVSSKLAFRLAEWKSIVGDGYVARSVDRHGKVGDSLSAAGIFQLVARYGEKIGLPTLAPHDMRRTYAQCGFENGIPITQLSVLLGHASPQTTAKYLNLSLDLSSTASDFVPLA
jgi:integrase